MLSDDYFYYSLTRKYVILFGNLFNNITIVKKNSDTGAEIERFKVPLTYAQKEKYFIRLKSDPDLQRGIQTILPRMSFEFTGLSYDSSRKQNSLLRTAKANNASRVASQYMGVPYDLKFELNLYARNIDDGNHVVEQILPYFNPDYTVTMNAVPAVGFLKDVPIVLDSVTTNVEHEGNFDSVRYVSWTLNFTIKAYYYGPISQPKIIRKAITNIYNDSALQAGYIVRINTASGNNGVFKLDDIIYQGDRYDTATAYGTVVSWGNNTGKLVIGGAQGTFKVNNTIRAVSTNATYDIASFDASALKLVSITIDPDPITANADSDYGYTTTIEEFPDTLT